MSDTLITLFLTALTCCSVIAWFTAIRRFGRPSQAAVPSRWQVLCVAAIAVGCGVLFAARWLFIHGQWQPLAAHLDGLLLIACLFALTLLYIQSRPRLFGLSVFALPILTLVLGWGICAATWTYKPFQIDSAWFAIHITSVYLGTCCAAMAAVTGGMYLLVDRRLRRKTDLHAMGQLTSLERLEGLIVQTATLGFALLSLALATGVVIVVSQHDIAPGWWYEPKVICATAAWAIYALVMNMRRATSFRGPRAAWCSIAGFILLLLAYAIVTALPTHASSPTDAPAAIQEDA